MIKRLLIANRGEIAVRVINTCKKMGITTIAVYSDADRNAKHTQLAHEAYSIGASEASASYLDNHKIINLAKKVSADAIHPGYGFLSENTDFVRQCEDNDIIFIGPRKDVVHQMGSKIESKHIALACDVPTVPGYFGEDQHPNTLKREAKKIGTPLLIKASAGGGGRGIRIVRDLSTFSEALELATKEALTAFGDASVLLERYIEEPRHLEVQVLGDLHGNIVHLFERECSIQRNHQKVIEEAPANFLDDGTRQQLFHYALRLANHIQYSSTGTVEFIVDNNTGDVFFLEMNTRLQVEHPVTENITGLDLVEWQIRIASGTTLPFSQKDITTSGWSIEARVAAENPAESYRPEIGHLTFYREPSGTGIRIDSGVQQHSEISPFYDSMIAKVIATGDNRAIATQRLICALDDFLLAGVSNNIQFLKDLLSLPAFSKAALTTSYLTQQFPQGWQAPNHSRIDMLALLTVAYLKQQLNNESIKHSTQPSPWHSLEAWRVTGNTNIHSQSQLIFQDVTGEQITVSYQLRNNSYLISIVESTLTVTNVTHTDDTIRAEVDGKLLCFRTSFRQNKITIATNTTAHTYLHLSQREALASNSITQLSGEGRVKAAMPGSIEGVKVAVGDKVKKGDIVVIMEAMKMVQSLASSVDGTISKVHYLPGDTVEAHAVLVEIEEI